MRIATFLFLLVSTFSCAQHNGYYGKKSYVEVSSTSNFPLLHNLLFTNYTTYKREGNSLIEKKDWFDTGFRVSAGYAPKSNLGFAFEFGMDFQNVPAPIRDGAFDLYITRHEKLSVRTMSFVPKLEFTNMNGLLPLGLNHQIGIGYTTSSVVDKAYVMNVDNTQAEVALVDFGYSYSGFTLLYALNMRTPITQGIMLNYGFRYTFNWLDITPTQATTLNGFQVNGSAVGLQIRRRRFNFLNFNLGVSVPF